jgi:hypothetical protein
MLRTTFTLFSAILILAACESLSQDDYKEYVFAESYLVANEPLHEVRVSTTKPVDDEYRFFDAALNNANVQIVLIDENGNDEEVFSYVYSEVPGIYVPATPDHRAIPKRTYRIDIDFNDRSEVLRAKTTVPDQFEIISETPDTLIYQSQEQLSITISAHEKVHQQKVYVFSAVVPEPQYDNLTPFYNALVDNDENVQIYDFMVNSSGLINEGNFEVNPDGSITLKFPWLAVAFYGENLVVANSIDKNLHDLVRSQQVQFGGGTTLSPGEIPNLIYNMEGGIGVFGSMATDTVKTYIKEPS